MSDPDASPMREERARTTRGNGASIRQVADLSGVSIATVSRVLNSPGLVSPTTAAKVQAAVRELGYRPNLFAKGLLTSRSRVLGVSLPDIHGEYYAELMHNADARARERGYHLLVSSGAHHAEETPGTSFALDFIDGIVVMLTERSRVDLDAVRDLNLPAVVIGVDRPGFTVDTITCDNASGAALAAEHLLGGTPPERCYFLGAHRGNLDSDERADAFARTLRDHGHEPREDQIVHREFDFESGWNWAGEMIDRGLLRGAGVFAANDEIAVGVANAARDNNIAMPADLRLVGFDDSRVCCFLRPELSSVRIPIADMAREAVDTLIRRIEEPEASPRHARLSTTLIVRDSSRVGPGGRLR
jgi:LacI family transcriptional regulator